MHVDIFADVICPWCLIGKRRLETALAQYPQPELTIRWRAFQLNPGMPADGMDRTAYLTAKFGGEANAREIYGNIRRVAEADGIEVNFEHIVRTPSTLASHRLLRLAGDEDGPLQGRLIDALFHAYFVDGRNVGDHDVLVEIADGLGMDADGVRTFLATDTYADVVEAEDVFARRAGINGVPAYVFNGKHMLAGAQPPEVLIQVFDLARQDTLGTKEGSAEGSEGRAV